MCKQMLKPIEMELLLTKFVKFKKKIKKMLTRVSAFDILVVLSTKSKEIDL